MASRLNYLIQCIVYLVLTFSGLSQKTVIANLPSGAYNDILFTDAQKKNSESLSEEFSGLAKIEYIKDTYPYAYLSTSDFWPVGSWGRGYHTIQTIENFYNPIGDTKMYYGSHPLARDASIFIRGHLNLYLSGFQEGNSLELSKKGIDYLLTQIYTKGDDRGAFDWWYTRENQTSINMDIPTNKASDYETAYALVALSEFYLSKIDYRRAEVLNAIQMSSDYLINRDWKLTNNNVRGLGAWALSTAYKATHDCSSLIKAKQICELLIKEVDRTSGDLNGTWQTGGEDHLEGYGNVNHDSKIFYHIMILRGLVETFDIATNKDRSFKKDLLETIKMATNHIIKHRLFNESDSYQLKYAFKTVEGKIVPWGEYNEMELEKYIETFSKLAYYASRSESFNDQERRNLKNLLNKISMGISSENKWHISGIGYYSNYIKAINEKKDVFEWDATKKCNLTRH